MHTFLQRHISISASSPSLLFPDFPGQVNIPDCYQDSRFDSSFDKLTGYHTKSMLVKPINDYEGNVTGVFQAINKGDLWSVYSDGQ